MSRCARTSSRKLRVAVLTNVIPPYRRPVFQSLCEDERIELAIFLSQPPEMSDSLALHTLPLHFTRSFNVRFRTSHTTVGVDQHEVLPLPLGLPFDLARYRPDLIVSGDLGTRTTLALAMARILRVPFAAWSEEIISTSLGISFGQRVLRRLLIPRIDYFLPWGEPAAEYLMSMGVADDRVFRCAQAVDNEYWRREVTRHVPSETKRALGLSGRVFLSVGRLVARKGFDCLLAAWSRMPATVSGSCSLAIVGAGEEEPQLRRKIEELGVRNVVLFGHRSQEELPRFYAAADIFVFPSLVDVWGLVVNEALASGLPVLASCRTGAGQGLIDGSDAGEVFDPLDVESFTEMLTRWAAGPLPGDRSIAWRLVAKADFSQSVQAIQQLVAQIV